MNIKPPFHQGELTVQRLANESDIGQRNGGVISNLIIPGAIPFIGQQKMVVLSSLDESGNVWASVLMGNPGFIEAPNDSEIRIDRNKIISHKSDPFWHNISDGSQVGLLVIELSTRRRLRVNGRITQLEKNLYQVIVEQAYPNCPKYIQRRSLSIPEQSTATPLAPITTGSQLTKNHHEVIARADSLFVASASPAAYKASDLVGDILSHGADASYRGGFPGFIDVDHQTLRIPDYQGNSMFNTLGNIQVYPKAGIVIIDFENQKLLHLSGSARILWNQTDPTEKSAGTKRFWELTVEAWQETPFPKSIDWQFLDYSPHNPREIKSEVTEPESLSLMVQLIEQKSQRIKRFRLVSADNTELPAFESGAHLPIDVELPNGETVQRHYSLLNAPSRSEYYEIAVQKEDQGRGGSKAIHQQLNTGMVLTAQPPRNEFSLQKAKHFILVAGGIGITPLLSMLYTLNEKNASYEIHYAARNKESMAFYKDVKQLAGDKASFYFSSDTHSEKLDLKRLIYSSKAHAHLYICGPGSMIKAARDLSEEAGWHPERIHYESFGSSTKSSNKAIEVKLAKTGGVVHVKPTQTILDALIESKVSVPYDCKRGECGMCATGLLAGEADHRDVYLTKEEAKKQICVCVSRAKTESIELDL